MPGEHILVIDDDPDMREALRLILEPAGYRLSACATGPEGLSAIRKEPPDLLLLDVMLASPSEGFHLAYELKNDEVLQRIPIIMISAIGQRMGMDFARELGSDYLPVERFLDKPLKADVVLTAVRQTLARSTGKAAT
ncbi:MAG: response regulator [Planctomycetes bacterium]|nr:response regulator [Planctomycetota bacterium]